jgi:flagellar protein FliO/FliZ
MASAISPRFLIVLATPFSAIAHAQTVPSSPDIGGSAFQMVFGLALVIALLFAGLWLLKRLSSPRGEAAGLIRVVAGAAVGARERVVVIEVGGTWLILGVAPGRVNALAEIPRGSIPQQPPQAHDFAGWLRRTLDRPHAR